MGDIINLNRIRKQREKAGQAAQAAQNRTQFGRTRPEKQQTRADADRQARDLAGKRLDRDDS